MNTAPRLSNTTSRPLRRLATMRDELRDRRRARASYRELERSLAPYASRSEANDLLATIAHQDGPDADRVRRMVARNLQHQATRQVAS
jgi:hypothetical protein